MRIPRRYLNDGEHPILATGTHPIRLLGPALRTLVGVGAALALGYYATPRTGSDPVDLVAAALALLVLARFLRRFLGWRRRRVVLTDQRVLRLSGGVIRRVGSVSLDRISEVDLSQGILGRMMGYGTLHIRAADHELVLPHLKEARDLWSLVSEECGRRLREAPTEHPHRTLAPGLPFDQQDTGPLPRVLV